MGNPLAGKGLKYFTVTEDVRVSSVDEIEEQKCHLVPSQIHKTCHQGNAGKTKFCRPCRFPTKYFHGGP